MTLCTICETEIPEKRLAALPNAQRCVHCQAAHDLNPLEYFGFDRLARVLAVTSEGDGEQNMEVA